MGDNSGTTLDEVPLEGISSTKIQMGIRPHLNQVSLDPDYVKMCEMCLETDIPEHSRIITSDDVFDYMLNIRNLNEGIDKEREKLFEEYLEAKYSHFQMKSIADYDQLKK